MRNYWSLWLPLAALTFLGPEAWALATGHPENTLSDYIWRFEKLRPGQPVWQWTAAHVLLTGTMGTLALWAFVHLAFGKWR